MRRIVVATRHGLRTIADRGPVEPLRLSDRSVTAVARDGPQLWAIVDRSEVWHAPEADWRRVATLEGHEATCVAMTDALHVGSSDARLFRLTDSTLEPVVAFDDAEGRSEWYTPWGGPPATRSISEWGDDVYVNVHVGGILHTGDHGRTWNPTIDIDADVHQVATAQGLVLGRVRPWARDERGPRHDVDDAKRRARRPVLACRGRLRGHGPRVCLDGPRGGRAGVYRGDIRGGAFERCTAGLPAWFDDNIDTYCLDALNDGSFAAFGTADGRLFGSDDAGATWHELASDLAAVQHVLVLPD